MKEPRPTSQFAEWLEKQRLAGRRLSIEFVMNEDTSVAIVLDRYTFGSFLRVAEDQGSDVRHMLAEALASTLGTVTYAKHRDAGNHEKYQQALMFGASVDLLRSPKDMIATFEDLPGKAAQKAVSSARQVIALAEEGPPQGSGSLN